MAQLVMLVFCLHPLNPTILAYRWWHEWPLFNFHSSTGSLKRVLNVYVMQQTSHSRAHGFYFGMISPYESTHLTSDSQQSFLRLGFKTTNVDARLGSSRCRKQRQTHRHR